MKMSLPFVTPDEAVSARRRVRNFFETLGVSKKFLSVGAFVSRDRKGHYVVTLNLVNDHKFARLVKAVLLSRGAAVDNLNLLRYVVKKGGGGK
jgi:hypothetical protein